MAPRDVYRDAAGRVAGSDKGPVGLPLVRLFKSIYLNSERHRNLQFRFEAFNVSNGDAAPRQLPIGLKLNY